MLVLTNARGESKIAAWTLDNPHRVAIDLQPASVKELSMVSGDGKGGKVEIEHDRLAFTLNGEPKYISLSGVHLK